MKKTKNDNLNLLEKQEFWDAEKYNENMNIIDEKIKETDDFKSTKGKNNGIAPLDGNKIVPIVNGGTGMSTNAANRLVVGGSNSNAALTQVPQAGEDKSFLSQNKNGGPVWRKPDDVWNDLGDARYYYGGPTGGYGETWRRVAQCGYGDGIGTFRVHIKAPDDPSSSIDFRGAIFQFSVGVKQDSTPSFTTLSFNYSGNISVVDLPKVRIVRDGISSSNPAFMEIYCPTQTQEINIKALTSTDWKFLETASDSTELSQKMSITGQLNFYDPNGVWYPKWGPSYNFTSPGIGSYKINDFNNTITLAGELLSDIYTWTSTGTDHSNKPTVYIDVTSLPFAPAPNTIITGKGTGKSKELTNFPQTEIFEISFKYIDSNSNIPLLRKYGDNDNVEVHYNASDFRFELEYKLATII